MPEEYPKFSDFAGDIKVLDGKKKRVEDVLNVEILITGYRVKDSKFKDKCLTIQFILGKDKYVLFTGSNVLIEQVQKYENKIPFYTTIKKIDKYYTLT